MAEPRGPKLSPGQLRRLTDAVERTQANGLTVKQLARRVGRSGSWLSNVLSSGGARGMSPADFVAVIKAAGQPRRSEEAPRKRRSAVLRNSVQRSLPVKGTDELSPSSATERERSEAAMSDRFVVDLSDFAGDLTVEQKRLFRARAHEACAAMVQGLPFHWAINEETG